MSKVFVTQVPMRLNTVTNLFEPAPSIKLEEAKQFGDIRIVLDPHKASYMKPEELSNLASEVLATFDVAQDYLLVHGGYAQSAVVVNTLSRITGGHFNMLAWDRLDGNYKVWQL